MIYKSNLTAPDLTPHFKHLVSRPMGHSFGHDVPSDWGDKSADDQVFGLYKNCGLWTHDEAAILYHVAKLNDGAWVDIGSHTGWTTAHLRAGSHNFVDAVDPLYSLDADEGFVERFLVNIKHCGSIVTELGMTSRRYFEEMDASERFEGFVIDGDHEPGEPIRDAMAAAAHLTETGVIMFHDGTGKPTRDAVAWLMGRGFHARAYFTPHLVLCCWRGEFVPPDHVPDQKVKNCHLDGRYPDFDFAKCK